MKTKTRTSVMIDSENYAKVEELAARLRLSRSAIIDRFITDGLAAEKFGQQLLFNPKGAREMLQEVIQSALIRASKQVSGAAESFTPSKVLGSAASKAVRVKKRGKR